jgi:HEPN domain-containing protein/predicted nucleotidyltransferase
MDDLDKGVVLKNLNDIKAKIIDKYQPETIILYGSSVTGAKRSGSDIDLLIIKKTQKTPIKRRIEVEKLLKNRLLALDLNIYTPEEMRHLFAHGSPFIHEIIEKGKVIYMRKVTENWLKDAQDELESAIILFKNRKYRGSCYHSQQCVEKGLKALILEKGIKPERIHDIVGLVGKISKLGWKDFLSMDDAVLLNSIYKGRYPTEQGLLPYGEPSLEDSKKALNAAKKLMHKIKKAMA